MFFLAFVMFAGNLPGQSLQTVTIPYFESTRITQSDSVKYKKLLELSRQYDFTVALSRDSYWFNAEVTELLCYKNGKWSKYLLLTNIKHKKSRQVIEGKYKLIKLRANQLQCDSVWKQMLSNRFLNMNQDSLDLNERIIGAGPVKTSAAKNNIGEYEITISANHEWVEHFGLSDGVYYKFVIATHESIRISGCYEPEELYKWMPEVEERKYFIECKNLFVLLFEKQ